MSPTHDYVIANGTGSSVRSDINDALAAVVSQNSSSTAPATTYAYMIWVDTTTNIVKMRNGANSAWIELFETDGEFGSKTFNGNITLNAQGDLRFGDSDSSNWVAFQAPATVASNVTWTLPSADGTANQTLVTNGSGTLSWATPTSTSDKITEGNTEAEVVDTGSDGHFKVTTEGTERLRCDSSGRLLVGTSTARSNFFNTSTYAPAIQIEGTTASTGSFSIVRNQTGSGPNLILAASGGSTLGSNTVVANNYNCGYMSFQGSDGTEFVEAAAIACEIDGTPGANDMPGRLVFYTTADAASSPTEAMRINNQRELLIGTTTRTANGGVLQISNGITFPATQSACSDVNTLDDYEEGTFTPDLKFGGASTGITYNSRGGRYTKVGRLVTASFIIELTNKGSSTGNATVTLPFGSDEYGQPNLPGYSGCAGYTNNLGATSFIVGNIGAAGYITNSTNSVYLTNANFANNSYLAMTVSYNISA